MLQTVHSNLMFFQINCGIPLELGRLPSKENGANLTVTAAQQQELSPPTPFADTKGTNCCFSEQTGQLLGAEVEEIGGDAPGMLFPSKSPSKFPSNVPMFPSRAQTHVSCWHTSPLEEALSTKLLLSVHRNVSWTQVLAVICSSEPQLASMRQETEGSLFLF